MPVIGTSLGSFPNSRIKPRPPTSTAKTSVQNILAGGTFVFPGNINRTYLTIRNESLTDDIRYGYPATIAPVSTNGFLVKAKEAIDIDSQEAITISNGSAVAIQVSFDEGQG